MGNQCQLNIEYGKWFALENWHVNRQFNLTREPKELNYFKQNWNDRNRTIGSEIHLIFFQPNRVCSQMHVSLVNKTMQLHLMLLLKTFCSLLACYIDTLGAGRKRVWSPGVVGFSASRQQRELPLCTSSVASGRWRYAQVPVPQQLWPRHELAREGVRMVEFSTGCWCCSSSALYLILSCSWPSRQHCRLACQSVCPCHTGSYLEHWKA